MQKRADLVSCVVLATACALGAFAPQAHADEGMWLPNAFPSDKVAAKYGFSPDARWLDHVRLSSARLAQGCSASFVSEQGLVMTNHHCAHSCVQQLSTPQKDLVASGYYAPTPAAEKKCPALEVNQLVSIEDVTASFTRALANLSGAAYSDAKKAEMARLEKACATSDQLRCEVVDLYHGARQHLYQYKRYQDVRLVFAPELAAAFFGGDPDNFNFPRYDLDVAFLRVYEADKPLVVQHYFPFSAQGAQANELTFTSGHPGSTSRELTLAELLSQRRSRVPRMLFLLSELRGQMIEFSRRGPEQARYAKGPLFYIENSVKAYRGKQLALLDDELIPKKRTAERALRMRMAKDKRPGFSTAFASIEAAVKVADEIADAHAMLESRQAFGGDLFAIARSLVRAGDELPKPNEQRLPEFTDAALPGVKQMLFSPAPIYPELEILRLTFGLTKLRELLGADDPVVRKLLGKKSPQRLATELVRGSTLKDVATRKKLFEGGKAALDASRDPLIAFARLADPDARAVRKRKENEVDSALERAHQAIATMEFEQKGMGAYPDATFTLRFSFGAVKGWKDKGREVPPFTTLGGAFDRHTGDDPFALPKRWLDSKTKLKLDTPFNFVTTNDIVGGNSGSPVINQKAEIVGLIFDGNLPSLGGDYGFDEKVNRAVSVHSSAILETLSSIYGATRIAEELKAPKQQAAAPAPAAAATGGASTGASR